MCSFFRRFIAGAGLEQYGATIPVLEVIVLPRRVSYTMNTSARIRAYTGPGEGSRL